MLGLSSNKPDPKETDHDCRPTCCDKIYPPWPPRRTAIRLAKSVFLHLAPGAVVTLVYILLVPPLLQTGLPKPADAQPGRHWGAVPLELWILFGEGKKKTGRYTLQGVVLNRERDSGRQLVGLGLPACWYGWRLLFYALAAHRPAVQKNFVRLGARLVPPGHQLYRLPQKVWSC